LADAGIADAVDGAVGPFRGRGREWGGVGVVGRGVEGEHDEAFAIAPVHFDLADVEELGVTAPAPCDVDLGAGDDGVDVGLDGGEVGAGLLRAFDAERGADGFVIGGVAFDLFYQGAKTDFDAGSDGGHGGG
jgi:hypothetical protein